MDYELVAAQTLKYAEDFGDLFASERAQRLRAEEAHVSLELAYRATVRALATALDLRDYETGGHAERVTRVALRLAKAAAPALTSDLRLEYGFLLHDVGKIGVPDAILLKPGPLDPHERARIEQHPALGAQIIESISFLQGLARDVVLAHHERWDGRGYPSGIAADAIPLAARIFAFADAFDAMTNDRPYRRALAPGQALDQIRAGAGTQFDPELTPMFVALMSDHQGVS